MARRSGLGKGLGALIPAEVSADRTSALVELPVTAVRPNPRQPRHHFDEEALAGLTASIRELGVLQPILVRRTSDDTYELIAGERRWRSAKRAGLRTIPAVVRDVTDASSLEEALVENLHREDLGPLEEAAAYQQLIEDFGLTHEMLAARIGRSRAAISNTLRLFQLPPSVQRLVADGTLTAGHARALLGTPDRAFQEQLARRTVTEQLSVRAVEDAVRTRNDGGASAGPTFDRGSDVEPDDALDAVDTPDVTSPQHIDRAPAPVRPSLRPPGVLELEDLLSEHLDTRVAVDLGGRRGRVVIEFADLEDLERIYRAMTEPGPV